MGKTLIITHDHCALHETRKNAPERPKRLEWVMNSIKALQRDLKRDLNVTPLDIREVKTSEPMLAALQEQLVALTARGASLTMPSLMRTASVGALPERNSTEPSH